jgi:PIN domain nuclease of toxin-antitoxin system
MNLLFDTHAFIWWADEPARLSPRAYALCSDRKNALILSLASVWEIQIKFQLGKLKLKMPLADLIESQQKANQIVIMPISLPHILNLDSLPAHHRDPFDRLLIAQARFENIAIITGDSVMSQYAVLVEW